MYAYMAAFIPVLFMHTSTRLHAGMPPVQISEHAWSHLGYDVACTAPSCMHGASRNTALIWAASKGHGAAVAALLKVEGIDINAKDNDG